MTYRDMQGTSTRHGGRKMNGDKNLVKVNAMIEGLKSLIAKGNMGQDLMFKLNMALEHSYKAANYMMDGNTQKAGMNLTIAYDLMQAVHSATVRRA